MVEADYRMKLVGLGLEDGVLGVTNYLDSLAGRPGERLDVLRWWFTLDYEAVQTTPGQTRSCSAARASKFKAKTLRLTDEGRRVATGQTKGPNERFARSFTEHLPELAQKYPVYADLQNVCDLALVAALLKVERLPDRVGWHLTFFGSGGGYEVARGEAPKESIGRRASRAEPHKNRRRRQRRREHRSGPFRQTIGRPSRSLRASRRRSSRHQAQADPDAWWWD